MRRRMTNGIRDALETIKTMLTRNAASGLSTPLMTFGTGTRTRRQERPNEERLLSRLANSGR